MKHNHHSKRSGFTLIELLVVIAIMGILAAMIIPVVQALERTKKRKVARAELNQVMAMIEAYKSKTGFFPPDNPYNTVSNQLYFELSGCLFTNLGGTPTYITLDGSATIPASQVPTYFGGTVTGFANSSATKRNTDDATAAQTFVTSLRPNQVGQLDSNPEIKILACAVEWPGDGKNNGPINAFPRLSPWQYNSSHPTNNPGSFDLWVDIFVSGKTNRISNWNPDYQQL